MKTTMRPEQVDKITEQIQKSLDYYRRLNNNFEDIEKAFGIEDYWTTPSAEVYCNLFDDYLELVMKKVGDRNKILFHYIFNTDCGKQNLKLYYTGTTHLINSDKSLISAIIFFIDTGIKVDTIEIV